VRQPLGVVHVFVACQAPEHGLAKLSDQRVAAVLARPGIRKDFSGQVCQAKCIIEIPEREQASIGRHSRPMEFQLQAAVKSESKMGLGRFTRWVLHASPPRTTAILLMNTPELEWLATKSRSHPGDAG
jgi:hypothetical protein